MLEWVRELLDRLRRRHPAVVEIPKSKTGQPKDRHAPAVPTEAFERFLEEYQAHNEDEVSHHTPGNRAA